MTQDYLHDHRMWPEGERMGRMVALVGDAELDEGNVFEALLEGWKHDVRNLWWVIDYNRQSLDGVVHDKLFQKITDFFHAVGWKVVTLKYGKKLQRAFEGPAGRALRDWIDNCPNDLYSALTFKGGAAWREHLERDLAGAEGLDRLLAAHDDDALHALMTNLAGHDMEAVIEAFDAADGDERPHCFIAYTVKGFGLPFQGHKDNHAGLMTVEQMDGFRRANNVPEGREWERFAGLEGLENALGDFLARVPFNRRADRIRASQPVPLPTRLDFPQGARMSTQEAFGKILVEIARSDSALSNRIVTTSPDVTVSTNLGGWVNQRGLFNRVDRRDVFREEKVVSAQKWALTRRGQHIELGIAENNLFLMLAALGLSGPLFGERLLPIGTLYDPFIARGLDALNYATYQGARFMVVATPSGVSLAPEGGAHQSISTPLIGLGQPGLASFEPAFADELAEIMAWGFAHMQAEGGGSVYLRLSTRQIEQPRRRDDGWREGAVRGAYWIKPPSASSELALVYTGVIGAEVLRAVEEMADDVPEIAVLAVTSADRLYHDWQGARRQRLDRFGGAGKVRGHVAELLGQLPAGAPLVTVHDGHPATLSWLGGVDGRRIYPLGVETFGQSGDIVDLYRTYGLDSDAIVDAVAQALTERRLG